MNLLPHALLLTASAAQVPASPVQAPFQDLDFEAAAARAMAEGRILLVALVAADSEDCRRLTAETWSNAEAVQWIEEEAVAIALEAREHALLLGSYEVHAIPTVLWLEAGGAELSRHEGFVPPGRLLKAGREALELERSIGELRGRLAEAPGDPELYLALARACAGVPARALQALEEAWRLGRGVPSFERARLGAVLTEVAALAREYDPARKALLRWRSAALEGLADPAAALRSAGELAAINRARGDPRATAEQYERLRADPAAPREVLEALFDHEVAGLYFAEKRYAELLEGLGDVFARTEQLLAELEADRARERASPPPAGERRFAGLTQALHARTGMYLEALLHEGRGEEARDLIDFVLLREPAAGSYLALWRAAKKSGAPELASEIRERGLAALSGRELEELESQIERAERERER
jgi:hypothetical protein